MKFTELQTFYRSNKTEEYIKKIIFLQIELQLFEWRRQIKPKAQGEQRRI